MAGNTTPERRLNLIQGGVAGSRAVRAVHWIDAARLNNWVAGRGSMDVPAHAPGVSVPSAGSSTFSYWTKPRYQTTRYAYGLVLSCSAPTTAEVTIDAITETVRVQERRNAMPLVFYRDRSAQSDAEAQLQVDIAAAGAGDDVAVECISVEALPRFNLQTGAASDDLGADRLDFFHRQAIDTTNIADQSLARLNDLRDSARRVGGFQFSFGDDSPWSMASGSWTDVFDGDFELLGRYLYSGETTREHSWRIKAYCSDASTKADVRIWSVSDAAGVSTIPIPTSTTTATWLPSTSGAAATFDVDAENNAAADGRRTSGGDRFRVQVQRTTGTGTVYLESVSIFEA